MPKYRPEIAKAKAERLIKPYISNGLNQTALAKQEGVTQSAISQRLSHSPVRSALQEAFRKVGISTKYKAKKFKELLEAKRPIACDIFIRNENGRLKVNKNSNDWIEVEDNNARVATLRLLSQVEGDIKDNGNGKKISAIIIVKVEGINGDKISPTQRSITSIQR